MPEILVAKPFTLTHPDGSSVHFKAGKHPDVADDVAEHWFVKANLVGAKPNPSAGSPAFLRAAAEKRAELDAEKARLEAEQDAVVVAHVREKMQAELDARVRIAIEESAIAAAKGVDAEVERRVAAAMTEFEARQKPSSKASK